MACLQEVTTANQNARQGVAYPTWMEKQEAEDHMATTNS